MYLFMCCSCRPVPLATGDRQGDPSTSSSSGPDDEWMTTFDSLVQNIRSARSVREELRQPDEKERVFLVAAATKESVRAGSGQPGYSLFDSLEELSNLASTAGLRVVGRTHQVLEEPNPRTYIGSGKLEEIVAQVEGLGFETVIFDDELSPGQQRNLEKALGKDIRVCDRTALILDIFSQRAATREGKLQVELAQVDYQTPRLSRMWSHLDRVAGGGKTKGTGEKQIEVRGLGVSADPS